MIVSQPSTTTVPVATASRSLAWKWPWKPGKLVGIAIAEMRDR